MDPSPSAATPCGSCSQALDVVLAGAATSAQARATVGSHQADRGRAARRAGETLRTLARDAPTLEERIDLVNQANAVRSWTLT